MDKFFIIGTLGIAVSFLSLIINRKGLTPLIIADIISTILVAGGVFLYSLTNSVLFLVILAGGALTLAVKGYIESRNAKQNLKR